jgi:hypothetical protein
MKRPLGRPGSKLEDNIKMHLKHGEDMDGIHVDQDRDV